MEKDRNHLPITTKYNVLLERLLKTRKELSSRELLTKLGVYLNELSYVDGRWMGSVQ